MSRTIIIGDVHGCAAELQNLMGAVIFDPATDHLIFVGDLINKGPDSLAVLDYCRNTGATAVVGNHELSLLRHQHTASPDSWQGKLLAQMGPRRQDYLEWIASWPAFLESDQFIVVHGGLVPGRAPADTPREWLANIRTWDGVGSNLNQAGDPPWYEQYTGRKLIVYGHWAVQGLTIRDHTIGLDSGCCYGRKLSALILPDRRIVQVSALQAYCPVGAER